MFVPNDVEYLEQNESCAIKGRMSDGVIRPLLIKLFLPPLFCYVAAAYISILLRKHF